MECTRRKRAPKEATPRKKRAAPSGGNISARGSNNDGAEPRKPEVKRPPVQESSMETSEPRQVTMAVAEPSSEDMSATTEDMSGATTEPSVASSESSSTSDPSGGLTQLQPSLLFASGNDSEEDFDAEDDDEF